jgi:hypothetical protein
VPHARAGSQKKSLAPAVTRDQRRNDNETISFGLIVVASDNVIGSHIRGNAVPSGDRRPHGTGSAQPAVDRFHRLTHGDFPTPMAGQGRRIGRDGVRTATSERNAHGTETAKAACRL